jgi:hypothetical protein
MDQLRSGVLPDAVSHRPDPEYIRRLLELANVSQRGFARVVGINERTMRDYVVGASPMPYSVQFCLETLARRGMVADSPLVALPWMKPAQRAFTDADVGRVAIARTTAGSYVAGVVRKDGFGFLVENLHEGGTGGSETRVNALTEYVLVPVDTSVG